MTGPFDAKDFTGRWLLSRVIDDGLSKQQGTLEGSCVFTQVAAGVLDYHETGTLRFGAGAPLAATRRYCWYFEAQTVRVTFEDGRAFHSFIPSGVCKGTDHPCGDDFYQVRYDFSSWPRWQAVWRVTGPRKDYVSTTEYRPAPR